MRILHVNKFLYRKGGAEGYMEDLAALQQRSGATVAFWGMDHPENTHVELAGTFPSYVEFDNPPSGVANGPGWSGEWCGRCRRNEGWQRPSSASGPTSRTSTTSTTSSPRRS